MLYRILRSINAAYPLAILWLYIAAFVLGAALMFVFPQGTLLLLFVGLGGLGVAIIVFKALSATQHMVARHSLARGVCPNCGTPRPSVAQTQAWHCPRCHISFTPRGFELEPNAEPTEA